MISVAVVVVGDGELAVGVSVLLAVSVEDAQIQGNVDTGHILIFHDDLQVRRIKGLVQYLHTVRIMFVFVGM